MEGLDFKKGNGLIPAIVQDYKTKRVLMLAYINQESFKMTLQTGEAHYWSRSRNCLWHKGKTSGHVQKIKEIYVDCDNDTVLFLVEQVGGIACHTGHESCFYRRINRDGSFEIVDKKLQDEVEV
ncbi:MAG TPA: phosphoribosyl-AMP cyclohydrolase [Desulfobacteraceae bacterium]|nr:phosphoribosyl-AMP cyclohydrolase [Desulfobacteraceae bacterium]